MNRKQREQSGMWEHYAKYEDVAQKLGVAALTRLVPASRKEIAQCLETDWHLNNIPLTRWDALDGSVRGLAARAGHRSWSISQTVCVLKHVAKHHIAGAPAPEKPEE